MKTFLLMSTRSKLISLYRHGVDELVSAASVRPTSMSDTAGVDGYEAPYIGGNNRRTYVWG